MASKRAIESASQPIKANSKSDVENESSLGLTGPEHHHVVADKLARKLSARQVQMIAIGTPPLSRFSQKRKKSPRQG